MNNKIILKKLANTLKTNGFKSPFKIKYSQITRKSFTDFLSEYLGMLIWYFQYYICQITKLNLEDIQNDTERKKLIEEHSQNRPFLQIHDNEIKKLLLDLEEMTQLRRQALDTVISTSGIVDEKTEYVDEESIKVISECAEKIIEIAERTLSNKEHFAWETFKKMINLKKETDQKILNMKQSSGEKQNV